MPRFADVDGYISSLDGWKAEAVAEARQIVLGAAPEATEAIKWSQPVYSTNGPCIYLKAFNNSATSASGGAFILTIPRVCCRDPGTRCGTSS